MDHKFEILGLVVFRRYWIDSVALKSTWKPWAGSSQFRSIRNSAEWCRAAAATTRGQAPLEAEPSGRPPPLPPAPLPWWAAHLEWSLTSSRRSCRPGAAPQGPECSGIVKSNPRVRTNFLERPNRLNSDEIRRDQHFQIYGPFFIVVGNNPGTIFSDLHSISNKTTFLFLRPRHKGGEGVSFFCAVWAGV